MRMAAFWYLRASLLVLVLLVDFDRFGTLTTEGYISGKLTIDTSTV